MKKKILITGAAGFIGFHLVKRLLLDGYYVVGLDNLNDYYDPNLKYDRLKELGVIKEHSEKYSATVQSATYENFKFTNLDLQDRQELPLLFHTEEFDIVCNLAAQAGVRYSIENPNAYIDSNIVGFANLLECCRQYHVKRLVFASSSSVYGQNKKVPFSTGDQVDEPISLYAATKKSNELMAYTYSHLYDFETIGLRFFTVYGPWGRPDMAMFLFTDAIDNGRPIKVFNEGNLERDFTYVDDIVEGIMPVINLETTSNTPKYSLYNIGNSSPVKLMDFITEIEKHLGKKAQKDMLPMQPGDVERTWADVTSLKKDFGYNPHTSVSEGVGNFVKWYKSYYKK
ncbi:NAD-dependent epimerase [Salegentibacter sp. F188]|uniref:NAD-dependent epimerase n=1 Tax=Autumnicola patrickiae TaxID=3075591 RepID=A0ABU3E3F9_9FLAO|nr:NAD-dependent epimerase [Salegentibacter sp. F188]MDT0689802.1 NAD-dependent epimerase [Salegentibacter sp. F188]